MRQEKGRAIRRCRFEGLRRKLPTSAGFVFNHHRSAKQRAELFSQRAGNGIGAATGWEPDQQFNGAGLGIQGAAAQRQRCENAAAQRTATGRAVIRAKNRIWHGSFPVEEIAKSSALQFTARTRPAARAAVTAPCGLAI